MALPMDEQRILDEMERMLAADDPKLAARLAAFGQPGFGRVLRTRRARATLSVMALVLITAVAAVIYLMSSFRPGSATNDHSHRSVQATPSSGRLATQPAGQRVKAHAVRATARSHSGLCAATFAPNCVASPAPFLPRASHQAARSAHP